MTSPNPSGLRRQALRRETAGQALVETALVLPIFLLLLFGLIDGGRFVYTDSVMSQGAREGARLAAVEALWVGKLASDPSCVLTSAGVTSARPGAHVCPASTAILQADAAAAANRMTAGVGTISTVDLRCDAAGSAPGAGWTSSPATCSGKNAGDIVSVRVTYLYKPLTPIAGQIIGSVSRSGVASMAIN